MERTYVMLKPDTLIRKIAGKVITRIEDKNFHISNMKMINLDEAILREHYAHVADKPFFPGILADMMEGPVLAMIVEGEDVIQGLRSISGPTRWLEAPAGTIRGDYANDTQKNIIHCSDSIETAEAEIKRFFPESV